MGLRADSPALGGVDGRVTVGNVNIHRFQAVYSGEDLLAPLGETSKYNIVSVYRTDGTICHIAAALSSS